MITNEKNLRIAIRQVIKETNLKYHPRVFADEPKQEPVLDEIEKWEIINKDAIPEQIYSVEINKTKNEITSCDIDDMHTRDNAKSIDLDDALKIVGFPLEVFKSYLDNQKNTNCNWPEEDKKVKPKYQNYLDRAFLLMSNTAHFKRKYMK